MEKSLSEILKLAASQVGYKEGPKDNQTKYANYFDVTAWQWFNGKKNCIPGPEGGWCAIFICWLFTQVIGNKPALSFLGCPAPKYNCAAGCGYLYDYMKAKGYKSDIQKVKPGDIVFFKSGSKCAHVGIAESVSGGKVITIEGNKDNQVKRVTHNISSNIYFGVMSPDYSKAHWVGESSAPDPLPAKPEKPAEPDVLKAGDLMIVTTKHTELMLRAYPSTAAPIIQRMKKGWKVTYLGEEKNNSTGLWAKVRCNTIIGWACAKQNGVTYPYLIKA